MGLYDEIKCEYPLPDAGIMENFQSKSLNCVMSFYTVTAAGRLIHHDDIWETVPEEERPYYGKPEWEQNGLFRMFGCLKRIPKSDIDTNYHGVLNIYAVEKYFLYEYDLIFTDGNLTKVINKSRRI